MLFNFKVTSGAPFVTIPLTVKHFYIQNGFFLTGGENNFSSSLNLDIQLLYRSFLSPSIIVCVTDYIFFLFNISLKTSPFPFCLLVCKCKTAREVLLSPCPALFQEKKVTFSFFSIKSVCLSIYFHFAVSALAALWLAKVTHGGTNKFSWEVFLYCYWVILLCLSTSI